LTRGDRASIGSGRIGYGDAASIGEQKRLGARYSGQSLDRFRVAPTIDAMRVERIALALVLAVQIPNQAGKEYPKTIKRNLRRIRVLEKIHVLVLLEANINSKVNRSK
jgi:hypothetical protein